MASKSSENELNIYRNFAKSLALNLTESPDRMIAAAWITKLKDANFGSLDTRIKHMKLLIFVLQKNRLVGKFAKNPSHMKKLEDIPNDVTLLELANQLMKEDVKGHKQKKMQNPECHAECSADLREYVVSQEIPEFGTHMYYATSQEPMYLWNKADKGIFPKGFSEVDSSALPAVDLHVSGPGKTRSPSRRRRISPQGKKKSKAIDVLKESINKLEGIGKDKKHSKPIVPPLGSPPPPDDRDPPTWGSNLVHLTEPPQKDESPSSCTSVSSVIHAGDIIDQEQLSSTAARPMTQKSQTSERFPSHTQFDDIIGDLVENEIEPPFQDISQLSLGETPPDFIQSSPRSLSRMAQMQSSLSSVPIAPKISKVTTTVEEKSIDPNTKEKTVTLFTKTKLIPPESQSSTTRVVEVSSCTQQDPIAGTSVATTITRARPTVSTGAIPKVLQPIKKKGKKTKRLATSSKSSATTTSTVRGSHGVKVDEVTVVPDTAKVAEDQCVQLNEEFKGMEKELKIVEEWLWKMNEEYQQQQTMKSEPVKEPIEAPVEELTEESFKERVKHSRQSRSRIQQGHRKTKSKSVIQQVTHEVVTKDGVPQKETTTTKTIPASARHGRIPVPTKQGVLKKKQTKIISKDGVPQKQIKTTETISTPRISCNFPDSQNSIDTIPLSGLEKSSPTRSGIPRPTSKKQRTSSADRIVEVTTHEIIIEDGVKQQEKTTVEKTISPSKPFSDVRKKLVFDTTDPSSETPPLIQKTTTETILKEGVPKSKTTKIETLTTSQQSPSKDLDDSFRDVDNVVVNEEDISSADMEKYYKVENELIELDFLLNRWDKVIADMEEEHGEGIDGVQESEILGVVSPPALTDERTPVTPPREHVTCSLTAKDITRTSPATREYSEVVIAHPESKVARKIQKIQDQDSQSCEYQSDSQSDSERVQIDYGPFVGVYARDGNIPSPYLEEQEDRTYQEYLRNRRPDVPRTPPIFSRFKAVRDKTEGIVYDPAEFGIGEDEMWQNAPGFFENIAAHDMNKQVFDDVTPPQLVDPDQDQEYDEQENEKVNLNIRLQQTIEDIETMKRRLSQSVGIPVTVPSPSASPRRLPQEYLDILLEEALPLLEDEEDETKRTQDNRDCFDFRLLSKNNELLLSENLSDSCASPTKIASPSNAPPQQRRQILSTSPAHSETFTAGQVSPRTIPPQSHQSPESPSINLQQLKREIRQGAVGPSRRPVQVQTGRTAGRRRRIKRRSKGPTTRFVEIEEDVSSTDDIPELASSSSKRPFFVPTHQEDINSWTCEGAHVQKDKLLEEEQAPEELFTDIVEEFVDDRPVRRTETTVTSHTVTSGVIRSPQLKSPRSFNEEAPAELIEDNFLIDTENLQRMEQQFQKVVDQQFDTNLNQELFDFYPSVNVEDRQQPSSSSSQRQLSSGEEGNIDICQLRDEARALSADTSRKYRGRPTEENRSDSRTRTPKRQHPEEKHTAKAEQKCRTEDEEAQQSYPSEGNYFQSLLSSPSSRERSKETNSEGIEKSQKNIDGKSKRKRRKKLLPKRLSFEDTIETQNIEEVARQQYESLCRSPQQLNAPLLQAESQPQFDDVLCDETPPNRIEHSEMSRPISPRETCRRLNTEISPIIDDDLYDETSPNVVDSSEEICLIVAADSPTYHAGSSRRLITEIPPHLMESPRRLPTERSPRHMNSPRRTQFSRSPARSPQPSPRTVQSSAFPSRESPEIDHRQLREEVLRNAVCVNRRPIAVQTGRTATRRRRIQRQSVGPIDRFNENEENLEPAREICERKSPPPLHRPLSDPGHQVDTNLRNCQYALSQQDQLGNELPPGDLLSDSPAGTSDQDDISSNYSSSQSNETPIGLEQQELVDDHFVNTGKSGQIVNERFQIVVQQNPQEYFYEENQIVLATSPTHPQTASSEDEICFTSHFPTSVSPQHEDYTLSATANLSDSRSSSSGSVCDIKAASGASTFVPVYPDDLMDISFPVQQTPQPVNRSILLRDPIPPGLQTPLGQEAIPGWRSPPHSICEGRDAMQMHEIRQNMPQPQPITLDTILNDASSSSLGIMDVSFGEYPQSPPLSGSEENLSFEEYESKINKSYGELNQKETRTSPRINLFQSMDQVQQIQEAARRQYELLCSSPTSPQSQYSQMNKFAPRRQYTLESESSSSADESSSESERNGAQRNRRDYTEALQNSFSGENTCNISTESPPFNFQMISPPPHRSRYVSHPQNLTSPQRHSPPCQLPTRSSSPAGRVSESPPINLRQLRRDIRERAVRPPSANCVNIMVGRTAGRLHTVNRRSEGPVNRILEQEEYIDNNVEIPGWSSPQRFERQTSPSVIPARRTVTNQQMMAETSPNEAVMRTPPRRTYQQISESRYVDLGGESPPAMGFCPPRRSPPRILNKEQQMQGYSLLDAVDPPIFTESPTRSFPSRDSSPMSTSRRSRISGRESPGMFPKYDDFCTNVMDSTPPNFARNSPAKCKLRMPPTLPRHAVPQRISPSNSPTRRIRSPSPTSSRSPQTDAPSEITRSTFQPLPGPSTRSSRSPRSSRQTTPERSPKALAYASPERRSPRVPAYATPERRRPPQDDLLPFGGRTSPGILDTSPIRHISSDDDCDFISF